MLSPAGFMSYARSDDENSGGKVSTLRRRLIAEMQLQVGKQPIVEIFQDCDRIRLGSAWEQSIRDAIDRASFFTPILTPAFLQSEWCCKELQMFRQRNGEAERKHALIFPILFIDIDPHRKDLDQEVLTYLQRLHWADFRTIHLKRIDKTRLATLARDVHAALLEAEALHPLRSHEPAPAAAPKATKPDETAQPAIATKRPSRYGPAITVWPNPAAYPAAVGRRFVTSHGVAGALVCCTFLAAAGIVWSKHTTAPSPPTWTALPPSMKMVNMSTSPIKVFDGWDPGAGVVANILPYAEIPYDPGPGLKRATIHDSNWIGLTIEGKSGYVRESDIVPPKAQ